MFNAASVLDVNSALTCNLTDSQSPFAAPNDFLSVTQPVELALAEIYDPNLR